ncbi:uncharacterized protein PADG_08014 [Paracoccidioides brasiliensis Pb18]|uniref:RlpA-like protein double-psi beta-barrel domain-containing protein n=1 Tax=Paracoccidioides brasiliensis (strain Pb18) TaxID=502780 RepID=C1GL07_PARBD|nr:uncharacterized protein PADG_08014 [Paracoccidioides brasiliensis Pb18]EEH43194.1 hypothetical protein PADG_08014 [Paracoccidioides brasiliensis Pb18]
MPRSISTVSSLTRTVSSTSLKSLHENPVPVVPLQFRLPKPEPATVKQIKNGKDTTGGGVQTSISEIPKRKPVPPPKETYQDGPSLENGTLKPLSTFERFKHSFIQLRTAWPPAAVINNLKIANIKENLRFNGDKKKQRLFLGGVIGAVFLLILIIGLAAGLSKQNRSPSNLPLPTNHGGPYTGDLTYYDPGLGACGIDSKSSDAICAVSHFLYDAVSTSSNPNLNPLCGKKLRLRKGVKSVDVTVVDRCVGCQPTDIDVSISVFTQLALEERGRVGVEWAWLEDTPLRAPTG